MIESNEVKTIVCPLLTAAYAEQEECMDKCAWLLNIEIGKCCSIPVIATVLYKMQIKDLLSKILRGELE